MTDSSGFDLSTLEGWYFQMQLIRAFDTRVVDLFNQKLIRGSAHPYIGMEASAVGVCSALSPDDYITATHRGHGHCLARGLDPARMLAEILGRESGYCRGKGGSMHITAMEHGMLGADAIVGGSHAISVGAAYGLKLQGRESVVVCFFGDGAASEGSFHEACNLASVLDAPVVFVCENNQWALSTPVQAAIKIENIADRAAGYGFPGVVADGNDVIAMHEAAAEAVERARAGSGPTLIEAKTYRMTPHSAFATGQTSTEEELAFWRKKDPIDRLAKVLLERGIEQARLDELKAKVAEEIEQATASAIEAAPPSGSEATEDVYVPAAWLKEGLLA
jgi:TPP-dependent pyruvate/acetoin dehydrogenase alpha subunit